MINESAVPVSHPGQDLTIVSKLCDIDVTLAHNSSGILNVAVQTVAVRVNRPPFSGRSKITTFPLPLTMVALSLSVETVNLRPSVDDQLPSARLRAGYRDGVGGQPGKAAEVSPG